MPVAALVIVESPNKVRSIAAYLGDGYVVDSSVGHIRDLPNRESPLPEKYRKEPWARLGVDIEGGFTPHYVVSTRSKPQIAKLKKLLKDADELVLATDEDREGEAIAWHLLDELKPKVPVKRIVFNEITKPAIQAAIANPRDVDMDLVDAQETRRILDRIYGYEVSPVLWKKVMTGLSAGRVQSVATRLVVDRERDRLAFKSASYWDLDITLDGGPEAEPRRFDARLTRLDGTRIATGASFGDDGQLKKNDVVQLNELQATTLADGLRTSDVRVTSVEAKPKRQRPYPPFKTTTLQQDASRKFGFGAARTMQVAQRLYEGGFITYMRTDSVTLSQQAIHAARDQVQQLFGEGFLPEQSRQYSANVKNAQEAHEAIRPSGEVFRTPQATGLSGDEYRLYEVIWKRTLASQMADAQFSQVSVKLNAPVADGRTAELTASGRTIVFPGWIKAYTEAHDDRSKDDDRQAKLPILTEGQSVTVAEIAPAGHHTSPPARYTEATLVKELEDREIGRPSTYASIIETIQRRGYVYKKGTALVPAWIAFSVTRLLEEHFARLVDYGFTAELEGVLDEIAHGREDRVGVLESFWTGEGPGNTGLKRLVENLPDIDARDLATFRLTADIAVRVGRYGPYVEGPPMLPGDGGELVPTRANVPDDLPPDELTVERAIELLASPSGAEKVLGSHPETGLSLVVKNGRFGPYVTESLPEDAPTGAKARTASLFASMTLDSVTLEDALGLLTLPRVVGTDIDGAEITAQNGRYGPYLKKGTDSRSLESEEQLFTVTEEQARAMYAQPKTYGRAAAKPPLKELGDDPVSGKPIVLKDGRFGLYVTDGEHNATLRKDDTPESITPARAAELLADRRARGPAKKATRKKAPAKKTAKKTTAKKAAAKKS